MVFNSAFKGLIYRVTQKRGTIEMRSGSHVQLAALRNRDLELQTTSPFSNHGCVERSTACFRHKNVLVLLGFQKFPFFCVTRYKHMKPVDEFLGYHHIPFHMPSTNFNQN